MEDSSLGGRTGGREGDAGRCCTGTDSNIDEEEKEEKEAGNKKRRGEERTREAGEKDGGIGKVRGGKEKASRKGEREEEERPGGKGRKERKERRVPQGLRTTTYLRERERPRGGKKEKAK
jgi:hypothetical protein